MSILTHYITTAIRSAKRDRSGFFINLLGLITGFMVFTLTFAFANYEESYDQFFDNADRIYIPNIGIKPDAPFNRRVFYSYFPGIVPAAVEASENIEAATHIFSDQISIKKGNEYFPSALRYVSNDFFKIFNLNYLQGDPEAFISRPDGIMLSQTAATRFFGNNNPMGQTLIFNDTSPMTVVGVFADLPLNSHFRSSFTNRPEFNILAPIAYWEKANNTQVNEDWGNVGTNRLSYLLVKEGTNIANLEEGLTTASLKHLQGFSVAIFEKTLLRPLRVWNLNYWDERDLDGPMIARAAGVALLAIAVLNSISLNSVRMLGRSQEIGLRRIMGASRQNLASQFLAENLFLATFALIVAVGLVWFSLPYVGQMMDRELDVALMFNAPLITTLVGCMLLVGILSASYPIALLTGMASGFSLTRTLRVGNSSGFMRKAMTTAQFAIVTALLFSVIVVNEQNDMVLEGAPEIKSTNIYSVEGIYDPENRQKIPVLRDQTNALPDVAQTSLNSLAQFSNNTSISFFTDMGRTIEGLTMQVVGIDDQYLDIYGFDLIAGRNLDKNRSEDFVAYNGGHDEAGDRENTNVIVNAAAVRALGFISPDDAIGKTFVSGAANDEGQQDLLTIVGVIPDIRIGSQSEEFRPMVMYYDQNQHYQMTVRFKDNVIPNLEALEAIVKEQFPGARANIRSIEEMREAAFRTSNQIERTFFIVALIAIILATTGLYALAHFMARGKRREVGLRKVMGAKTSQILSVLYVQFSVPILVAMIIGLPVGFQAMQKYLTLFPDRIDLNMNLVVVAALITIVIAWATMTIQILKAARTHPAEVLGAE